MQFDPPLIAGVLIRRYKRFLADVEIDGRFETAHCANPGSMLGLARPGAPILLSASDNPKRKLRLTWELVKVAGALVGITSAKLASGRWRIFGIKAPSILASPTGMGLGWSGQF